MTEASTASLFFRTSDRFCALPLDCVAEILRPQPVKPAAGAPSFVLGLSRIRGQAVPVLDLALLLGDGCGDAACRLIRLRIGDRAVALAVASVLGVRLLPARSLQQLPPLLDDGNEAIAAIVSRDPELLLMLRPARLLCGLEALDAAA
jgi:purine-binding chemotaxis protein CheW